MTHEAGRRHGVCTLHLNWEVSPTPPRHGSLCAARRYTCARVHGARCTTHPLSGVGWECSGGGGGERSLCAQRHNF